MLDIEVPSGETVAELIKTLRKDNGDWDKRSFHSFRTRLELLRSTELACHSIATRISPKKASALFRQEMGCVAWALEHQYKRSRVPVDLTKACWTCPPVGN